MKPEERAEIIAPCWPNCEKDCECPMSVMRPLIAATIRGAVEESRPCTHWVHRDKYLRARAAALEEAEKVVDCMECKLQIHALREVR